jgi:23S rRNA G2445 N2-methylase RlmL
MRSSVAASLGKVGGERALELLREAASTTDPELHLVAAKAVVMAERTATRSGEAGIDAGRTAPRPVEVVLASRRGLEGVLAEELSSAGGVESVQVDGPGRVRARLVGPLSSIFSARTWAAVHFPLAGEWTREGERPAEALARAMSSTAAATVLETWTVGAVRYRIDWVDSGHKRAATWDAVRAIAARAPHLVNDPTGSNWQLRVSAAGGTLGLSLVPHALLDPRFSWRKKDVPAASHPTIAAALARIAGARPDDVVWDPFVGSGGELVERARLGPYRALVGTDVEPRALAAARANLTAAGVEARLEGRDALTNVPGGVTLVITNPPMGRRSSRQAGIFDLLDRFVAHVATVLVPGGRFVWISPTPVRAVAAGERAGLRLERRLPLDMGGFEAEIQMWRRVGAGESE